MIKQIQLRGISRTPSDRMSEDGGLSESINMYLDTAENAPALVPNDVTTELGLPENLQGECIFIHKTANYENYIVVQEDKVVAYTPDIEDKEPLTILELTGEDKVNDITSMGNTLVISTTETLYYLLYKTEGYVFLGNSIPFPQINFYATERQEVSVVNFRTQPDDLFFPDGLPTLDAWNKDYNEGKTQHSDTSLLNLINSTWDFVNERVADELKNDYFFGSLFVRYGIQLYNDSIISSVPILLSYSEIKPLQATFTKDYVNNSEGGTSQRQTIKVNLPFYKIYAKLENYDVSAWQDIVKNINIYISKYPIVPQAKGISRALSFGYIPDTSDGQEYTLELGDKTDTIATERVLRSSAETFLVNQCSLSDPTSSFLSGLGWNGLGATYNDLKAGTNLQLRNLANTTLESNPMCEGDMKHYIQHANRITTYNNRVVLQNPRQIIRYDYNWLNAYEQKEEGDAVKYDVTWVLENITGDAVVKKHFEIPAGYSVGLFQIFPDSRARKMYVVVNNGSERRFELTPHPYLDCAYFFSKERSIEDGTNHEDTTELEEQPIDDVENKIFISSTDSPFTFPNEGRYTFQSKVLGVAVATTALSQGQFGQFPLYVFTEDGIWAMETASDGSFVSQKPISREVCVNPDSITSIDNAVVFVTSKAVMMIQGSEVMNISPYMNGRHYILDEKAKDLIQNQAEYDYLLTPMKDENPFMKFMTHAKVAYDYAGQRLIFMSKDEKGTRYDFQYVYKIDTQTWHKMAFEGFDLIEPLNSYPECLVMAEEDEYKKVISLSTVLDASREQSTEKGCIITRPFDLGMPDVFKSITDIKIRGDYDKGNIKYILQGSNDGKNFYVLNTLRGQSWKMFRIIILADLEPTERISWIDVNFVPRFQNRLR